MRAGRIQMAMETELCQTPATRLLRDTAEWHLLSMLFARPTATWSATLIGLASGCRDADLLPIATGAREATEGDLAVFGPGGVVSPLRDGAPEDRSRPDPVAGLRSRSGDANGMRAIRLRPDNLIARSWGGFKLAALKGVTGDPGASSRLGFRESMDAREIVTRCRAGRAAQERLATLLAGKADTAALQSRLEPARTGMAASRVAWRRWRMRSTAAHDGK